MGRPQIVLIGLGPRLQGLSWETDNTLRIGRQENLDIIINDLSVDRRQAEVVLHNHRWVVRDLAGNDRFPTLVNGNRVGREGIVLHRDDVIQCGKLGWQIAALEVAQPEIEPPPDHGVPSANGAETPKPLRSGDSIKTSGSIMRVQAATAHSWDQALEKVAFDRSMRPQQGQGMLTLLRTGYHLCHIASLDELLHSILADTVSSLNAQRGSIVLADPRTGEIHLRAQSAPRLSHSAGACFSKTLTKRCFRQGESLLCRDINTDADLVQARSVRVGTMSSVICAFLRSPRKRIGVMQLDRGPIQDPFDEGDLDLADAIAASVAVAIESAQLVEEQREQFVQAVTCLARAVEKKDQYTGDHTKRVTDYSLLLAEELKLSPAQRYEIQIGTPLHDIGKIGIKEEILCKQGKLTLAEFEYMKTHTILGVDILQSLCNLTPMIPIVRHHHERWDGAGYPDHLVGEQIALTARIVAVADAFDAMTSNRPYRNALPTDIAFQELQKQAGSQFDPRCIQAFVRQRPLVETLMRDC